MNNTGQWAVMLQKICCAKTVKELEAIKHEATINKGLNFRQMGLIIGRCDFAIAELKNPSAAKPYIPNTYDEKRMKLKLNPQLK